VNDVKELVEAVAHWLAFEIACKRERFLSERALSYPLVQFAQSHNYELEREITGGNSERIDYELKRDNVGIGYFEAKLIEAEEPNVLSFCYDIAKLLARSEQESIGCYLLVVLHSQKGFNFARLRPLMLDNDEWNTVSRADDLWESFQKEGIKSLFENPNSRPSWSQFRVRHRHHINLAVSNKHIFVGVWEVDLPDQ
jgi:hypothetical protein